MKRLALSLFTIVVLACAARADVTLPAIFSDHMVLQQDTTVPVWGWADPGEEVTVSIGGQSQSTKAGADGKWTVKLAKLKVGDTLSLTVKGKNTITVKDVLVGEVWLCSGQSNMAMNVGGVQNADQEKGAANFPKIRMFFEQSGGATEPQERGRGVWQVCNPATIVNFSATAYFFGREVHQKLGVPVGLVNSSVGGTAIEAWTSWDAQKDKADLKQPVFERWDKMRADWSPEKAEAAYQKQLAAHKIVTEKAKAAGKQEPRAPRKQTEPHLDGNHPANLFNGKIVPLIPYAIRGAIWYQGESNAGIGHLYQLQLTTMIQDWRARWGYDFPFAWVQLPDFKPPQKEVVEQDGWILVREGMLKSLALPHTGMAITLGTGMAGNIHPINKQDVGKRLAFWALGDVYKQKDVATSGPLPDGHKINGSEVTISFSHTDGGLKAKDGELNGFAIAGADKKWVKANAKIVGNKVVVSSPEVKQPAAVRYAWAANPIWSLENGAGLPATPFRTDDWK